MGFFKSVFNPIFDVANTVTAPVGNALGMDDSTLSGLIMAPFTGGTSMHFANERDREAAMKQALGRIPNIAKPGYPDYKSLAGDNGLLKSQYQLGANGQALDQIRGQAMGTGTSPWAQMMLGKENANLAQGKAGLGALGASQGTMAARQLGMKGGLRQADLQGLQARGARMTNAASQNLSRGAMMGRNAIMSQDASNRENSLSALPGMELQALKPQQFNITSALQEKRGQNIADLNKFQTEMSAWAGQGQSNAISKSGKK